MKSKYYSLTNLLDKDALFNVIFGERANGKTFACLEYAVRKYVTTGGRLAYLRRFSDDLAGNLAASVFDDLISAGIIKKVTRGEYNGVYYYGRKWYLAYYDDDGNRTKTDPTEFARGFALNTAQRYKGHPFPDCTTILFDEFISDSNCYLIDEFRSFMSIISTIVRQGDKAKIFLCGNTVDKFCPYFSEMGLTHIRQQKQGTIDVYTMGDVNPIHIAVEYAEKSEGKASDSYFDAFDNPHLKMITGGEWEMSLFPHLPEPYRLNQILFNFFIKWEEYIIHCEIVQGKDNIFIFCHRKTTEIRHPESDIIYSREYHTAPNYRRKLFKPVDNIDRKIINIINSEHIFFQDNEIGNIFQKYCEWARTGD